jgi:hypothetical protein
MTPRAHALTAAAFARSITELLIKDWPADKLTHQVAPTDNHVLWTLGHLAGTDAWMASVCGAPPIELPETFAKATGMGSKPTPHPSDYPPLTEAQRMMADARARIVRWFEAATDAQLATPLHEKTNGFAHDPIDFLQKLAWHEGWHAGQLASLRKSLGLPSIMG